MIVRRMLPNGQFPLTVKWMEPRGTALRQCPGSISFLSKAPSGSKALFRVGIYSLHRVVHADHFGPLEAIYRFASCRDRFQSIRPARSRR